MGHLPALVPGDGAPQRCGQRLVAAVMASRTSSARVRGQVQSITNRVVARQRPDGDGAVLPDDEVAFPVAGHGSVGGLGRPVADHDHVRDPAPGFEPAVGSALGPAGAQTGGQLTTELAPALHVQGLVDRLVGHLHAGIIGELGPEPTGDLLRRPPGASRSRSPGSRSAGTWELGRLGPAGPSHARRCAGSGG